MNESFSGLDQYGDGHYFITFISDMWIAWQARAKIDESANTADGLHCAG